VSIVRSGSKFRDTGSRATLPMLFLTGYPPPPLIGRRGGWYDWGTQTDLEHVWILSKHGNGVVVQNKIARAFISELQCSAPTDEGYQPDYPSGKRRYDTYQIETMSMQPLKISCMAFWLAGAVALDSQPCGARKPRSSCSARDIRKQNNQSVRWPFATSTCVCQHVSGILTSSSISFSGVNSLVTSKYSNRSRKASECFNHPTSTRRESEALRKVYNRREATEIACFDELLAAVLGRSPVSTSCC
jgi:hypothetical protein